MLLGAVTPAAEAAKKLAEQKKSHKVGDGNSYAEALSMVSEEANVLENLDDFVDSVSEVERRSKEDGLPVKYHEAAQKCEAAHGDVFFRKHCVVAAYLEEVLADHDTLSAEERKKHAVFVFDADVVVKLPPWVKQGEPIHPSGFDEEKAFDPQTNTMKASPIRANEDRST